jgi:branched-chain amino acid transport system permease protein
VEHDRPRHPTDGAAVKAVTALKIPTSVASAGRLARSEAPAVRLVRGVAIAVVFLAIVKAVFNPPVNLFLFGIANGSLYGLIAVGIILIYRTNRIINFAAAGLGAIPAVFAVLLNVKHGFPWAASLLLAVTLGVLLGALVDLVVVRRFATSPRLILTVATLGVVQVLALIAIYIPGWLGAKRGVGSQIPTPWKHFQIHDHRGTPILNGDYIFAVVVVLVMCAGLAAFFRFTRMGIALRASAENADRALLLGIPVRRVGTVAWMLAGLFGSLTIFLRAPLVGVPTDGSLGFNVLLFTLAAAVIARMDSVVIAVVSGMAVGILEQASVVKTGSADLSAALMLALVLGALLLQRGSMGRAQDTGMSTWQAVKEFRPTPRELRHLPEVRAAAAIVGAAALALVLGAPYLLHAGSRGRLTLLPIYAMVAVSLVILTGWGGQVSLGQFGIVGAGAAVAGGLAANHNIDFFAACIIGTLAGAAVALAIGLPALRVQGLYLAVTTLAFGAAMEFYFLKPKYWIGKHILPHGEAARITRPVLWQRLSTNGDRAYYYLCLGILVLVLLGARSFRRNRSGRVLIAARDNPRAAAAFTVNIARTRLAAFAVSGAIAGLAGVLLAYNQGSVDPATYGVGPSILIFLVTVIGGLTSLSGAIYGVAVIEGSAFFLQPFLEHILHRYGLHVNHLDLLFTGPGLILALLIFPGGYAEGLFKTRDAFLRRVAERRGIVVPSLIADRRVLSAVDEDNVIEETELRVEEVETFDIREPQIECPVCGARLALDVAAEHEHLKVAATTGGRTS